MCRVRIRGGGGGGGLRGGGWGVWGLGWGVLAPLGGFPPPYKKNPPVPLPIWSTRRGAGYRYGLVSPSRSWPAARSVCSSQTLGSPPAGSARTARHCAWSSGLLPLDVGTWDLGRAWPYGWDGCSSWRRGCFW